MSRITPAYAGKSASHLLFITVRQDHPCVCGEKGLKALKKQRARGSPLRMRGKAAVIRDVDAVLRITPAYAGKSDLGFLSGEDKEDHPCVCGEKCRRERFRIIQVGSPLRMRGKGNDIHSGSMTVGITPAYAGKRIEEKTVHGKR